jgi:hypothetical protein
MTRPPQGCFLLEANGTTVHRFSLTRIRPVADLDHARIASSGSEAWIVEKLEGVIV